MRKTMNGLFVITDAKIVLNPIGPFVGLSAAIDFLKENGFENKNGSVWERDVSCWGQYVRHEKLIVLPMFTPGGYEDGLRTGEWRIIG